VKAVACISLLVISNFFMTFAWYGHLQFKKWNLFQSSGLVTLILISWLIALFEYIFMVPGNRFGHESTGGPFNLVELKVIQEVISLVVFTLCTVFIFRSDKLQWNHAVGFAFLLLAVFFVFRKWN
jgi:uncharacterized protein